MKKQLYLSLCFLCVAICNFASQASIVTLGVLDKYTPELKVCFCQKASSNEELLQKYIQELGIYFCNKALVSDQQAVARCFGSNILGQDWQKLVVQNKDLKLDVFSRNEEVLIKAMQLLGKKLPHLKQWMIDASDE